MNVSYALDYIQKQVGEIYREKTAGKKVEVHLVEVARTALYLIENHKEGSEPVKYGATKAEAALVQLLLDILYIADAKDMRVGRTLSLVLNDLEGKYETEESGSPS